MLKGIRCETAKCPIEKKQRNVKPGMHGWRRRRPSEYAVRLREKQKVKRYYGDQAACGLHSMCVISRGLRG